MHSPTGGISGPTIPDLRRPTEGMIELRHVADAGGARAAYEALYGEGDIANLVRHHRWLLDQAGVGAGQRVLDLACGEGGLAREAVARGAQVWGVDLSRIALARGRAGRSGAAFGLADGERLPFAGGSFDRVLNIGSLEHFEDPLAGLREMARVLDPAGRACILVPNSFGLRWNVLHAWRHGDVHDDGQPIQRYGTRLQWTRLIEAAGLRVEHVLGCEKADDLPRGPAEWSRMLRHPSRWLILLARWIPVDMASMLVFICRPADRPG